jgi:hypothetical protein
MGNVEGFTMRKFIVCTINYIYHISIVKVIKSSRLRWACYLTRVAEDRSAFKILTGIPTGKIPLYYKGS